MSELAQRQRALLAVLKGRIGQVEAQGAYAQWLLASSHAAMLREVVLWWREFLISRDCRFTAALLKRRGDFAEQLTEFVRIAPAAALIEQQADRFLAHMAMDRDPLLAAMARTERGLIGSKRQPGYRCSVQWQHDPAAVFAFVLHGVPFEDQAIAGAFRFEAGFGVPGGMRWLESVTEPAREG